MIWPPALAPLTRTVAYAFECRLFDQDTARRFVAANHLSECLRNRNTVWHIQRCGAWQLHAAARSCQHLKKVVCNNRLADRLRRHTISAYKPLRWATGACEGLAPQRAAVRRRSVAYASASQTFGQMVRGDKAVCCMLVK